MATPIVLNTASFTQPGTKTTANAIASGSPTYAVFADAMTIDNSTNRALMVEFEVDLTFGAAPVAGSVQLYKMDWDIAGANQPPAPGTTLIPQFVGSLSPQFTTGNTVLTFKLRSGPIALKPGKSDFYLANNATGQSISSGAVITAQVYSPGT